MTTSQPEKEDSPLKFTVSVIIIPFTTLHWQKIQDYEQLELLFAIDHDHIYHMIAMPLRRSDGLSNITYTIFSLPSHPLFSSHRTSRKAHMAKEVEIPQDIIDTVIAEVGDDTHFLKQCSLVSSSFLFSSRRKLFSRITLRSDETCQGIHQLLVQNPIIQSSVRAITLEDSSGGKFPKWMNDTPLLSILRLPFSCLESFSVNLCMHSWNLEPWNWDSFSSELKDALSNIILSSNLKTLSFKGIAKIPITFFLQIVHLTTFEFYFHSPNDFDNANSSSLTSKGVAPMTRLMTPHAAIDRCVWRLNDGYPWLPTRGQYEILNVCLFFTNSGQTRYSVDVPAIYVPSTFL